MVKYSLVILMAVLTSVFTPTDSLSWMPPVGIPTPTWPVDLDTSSPSLPTPWTAEVANYYFIENVGCSDSRVYGRPGASRCSLPSSPPAGSVIVLNGTISGDKTISFSGNASAPIWIRGYSSASKPVISGGWYITGGYIVLEDLSFDRNHADGNASFEGHHLFVRNCKFRDPSGSSYGSGVGITGDYVIFYRSTVYEQGNWLAATDIDRHGIKIEGGASDVWIVDSTFYHCQGDGVQVGDQNNTPGAILRVYLGRNSAYENLQSCFWTKNATDVIFSENTCYGINYSNGGDGQGIGGQYDPKYVWILNNKIYNTKAGIKASGPSNGGGGPWYIIGNLVYSVASDKGNCNNYNVGGIAWRNDGGAVILFNTLHDVDMFLGIPTGSGIVVRNNIFSAKRGTACTALDVDTTFTHDYNLFTSSTYDPGAEAHRVVGDPKFVAPGSNFSLQSGSPAIGAANPTEEAAFAAFQSRYGIDIRKDILGLPRPQGASWDLGALEFSQSGTLPPPSNLRANP